MSGSSSRHLKLRYNPGFILDGSGPFMASRRGFREPGSGRAAPAASGALEAARLKEIADAITTIALADSRRLAPADQAARFRTAAGVMQFRDPQDRTALVGQAIAAGKATHGGSVAALAQHFDALGPRDQKRLIAQALDTMRTTPSTRTGRAFSRQGAERLANAGRVLALADANGLMDARQQRQRMALYARQPQRVGAALAAGFRDAGTPARGASGGVAMRREMARVERDARLLAAMRPALEKTPLERLGPEWLGPERLALERTTGRPDAGRAPARILGADAAWGAGGSGRGGGDGIDARLRETDRLAVAAGRAARPPARRPPPDTLQRAEALDQAILVLQRRARRATVAEAHGVTDRMADNAALVLAHALEQGALEDGALQGDRAAQVQKLRVHPSVHALIEAHRGAAADGTLRDRDVQAAALALRQNAPGRSPDPRRIAMLAEREANGRETRGR